MHIRRGFRFFLFCSAEHRRLECFISSRHATIDYKGGIYYLADVSSNGVYVNNEVEPIGRGNPRRLFNGDRLRMGDFEFEVYIDSGESLVMPLEKEPSVA